MPEKATMADLSAETEKDEKKKKGGLGGLVGTALNAAAEGAPGAQLGVGLGVGAAAGLARAGMNALSPAQRLNRRLLKSQAAMVGRGEDDAAAAAEQAKQQAVTDQGLAAQRMMIEQQAKAATGASPQADGQYRAQAEGTAGAQADAATKAASETARLRKAARDKRDATGLAAAQQLAANAAQDRAQALDFGLAAMSTVPELLDWSG